MFQILSTVSDVVTTQPDAASTMREALKVTGISLIGIFLVMGVFALAILILGKVCPEGEAGTK